MSESTATEAQHPTGPVNLTTIRIVHARLVARYGASWRNKWAGLEIEVVEKDWFHVLQRLPLWAIDYGLENLPTDHVPTAGQFAEVCRRSPPPVRSEPKRLDAPKPDPQRLKAAFQRMHAIAKGRKPTAWIDDLQDRVARGEKLSTFQKQCLEQAIANLAHRVDEVEVTSEDSRRTDELKRAQAARVAAYLREHPELQP
jgi:hypothetical protein